jgi:DNA-binding transcriptional LysR family regulator
MSFSLDQARALDAVARAGSIAKAAQSLHKVHSAVLYGIKTMEEQLGVELLDRSGYRASLTPVGERVLEQCRRILAAADEVTRFCRASRDGWEPELKVVFDGIVEPAPILASAGRVAGASTSTRIALFAEFLGGVEARYEAEAADAMITVVPPRQQAAHQVRLPPITARLVVHRDHPLAKLAKKRLALPDLAGHTFLTVRGSDQRLAMSTTALAAASTFHLSDFHTKKAALLQGLGFGWIPEYLVPKELASGRLVTLRWGDGAGVHTFQPFLYHREPGEAGRALRLFAEELVR